jgi:hypothetical protein
VVRVGLLREGRSAEVTERLAAWTPLGYKERSEPLAKLAGCWGR